MRSPSSRILINRVDIYIGIPGRDANGGPQMTFAAAPTYSDVPCTVQVEEYEERFDELMNRNTQMLTYRIMTAQPYAVKARDRIIYIDGNNVTHMLDTQANRDEAGRGGAFTIRATEIV